MYDSTYGDMNVTIDHNGDFSAYGGAPGDFTPDRSSGDQAYTWSPQTLQHDALTAGDTIPTKPFSYPTTGDAIKWWGDASGTVVGKTIGGPVGGAVGSILSGTGHALGDAYDARDKPGADNNSGR